MNSVLIFEDNYLMQESLKDLIELDNSCIVKGVFDTAKNMVRLYEQHLPSLIITDIDMPEVSGLQGLQQLKEKHPEAKVLIITVFEDNDKVLNAICLGANGYVLKSSTPKKMMEAIKDAIDGGAPLTPSIATKILLHFPKGNQIAKNELNQLTDKEKEVLEWLTKGYSYKMIAHELGKSVETIRTQLKKIYKKLNVSSNAEAIIKALG